MLRITNNYMTLTKGDSAHLTVNLKLASGEIYTMQSGDRLVLTVRKTPRSAVLLQSSSTTTSIDLTPEQTSRLPAGLCYYDVELQSGSDIYTVVGPDERNAPNLIVLEEVTYSA